MSPAAEFLAGRAEAAFVEAAGPMPAATSPPMRSRLYRLAPIGLGTVLVESLTSYINRLAWSYRVSARTLVAAEILPRLQDGWYVRDSPAQLGGFGRSRAMAVNAAGATAADWSRVLEQLTAQADLRRLTLLPWAAGLPHWGLLRPAPAWCPACLDDWREHGTTIYFPVIWMLQTVTHCQRHALLLAQRCSSCGKPQSALAAKSPPGSCTQCHSWLGTTDTVQPEQERDDDELAWQRWVLQAVDELCQAALTDGSLRWEAFPAAIATCVQVIGSTRKLGKRVQASSQLFVAWQRGTRQPSFSYLLRVCYVLGVTPVQLLHPSREGLRTALAAVPSRPVPRQRRTMPAVGDLLEVEAFLKAVADGREPPLAIPLVARRFGVGEKLLVHRFPAACARITLLYRAHRTARAKQRLVQEQAQVQRVTLALHAEGVTPSLSQVAARLSDPNILRRPEAKAAWRTLRAALDSPF